MSEQIYKPVVRYFHRLGLAIIGKDYINNAYVALNERVEKSESDMKQLKELYSVALDKWSVDKVVITELIDTRVRLGEEVNNYKQLVETLRGTIRDKQALIDAYAKLEKDKAIKANQ